MTRAAQHSPSLVMLISSLVVEKSMSAMKENNRKPWKTHDRRARARAVT